MNSLLDSFQQKYPYPIALAQVCRHWRTVALDAPTLWTNIFIMEYHTEGAREAARTYLDRSKTCPIFLTWFSELEHPRTDPRAVIESLIIPGAERWQRITLISENDSSPVALFATMASLDFTVLRDIEISYLTGNLRPAKVSLCHNAPLLRRCRLRRVPFFPSLPSNLVVLDCVYSMLGRERFDLDPLLEFLPHVSHSLEHLRFGPPTQVRYTPRTSKIPLENLKSLSLENYPAIVNHIYTPNLVYFAALSPDVDRDAAEMFEGFSAPMLKSIRFHDVSLQPVLTSHHLPSIFPQLESVILSGCTGESAFVDLLKPPEPKNPPSLQQASEYPPKHQEVENPFPSLKELTISDMDIWTSLQAAIEKRLKNGDESLRKIRLPKGELAEAILYHRQWPLPAQDIELVLYESGELSTSTPESQDDFCYKETSIFLANTH